MRARRTNTFDARASSKQTSILTCVFQLVAAMYSGVQGGHSVVYPLTGRTIVTTVDHVDSSPLQGSVLGPILFIIYMYMSDLPVAVKQNTCALFADDTLVYSTCCTPSRHPCCNLQEDIDAVQTWSSDWNATFNSAKSQQMVVGKHGCETGRNLVLGGDKLQQVCTVSHFGLTLNAEVVRPCIRHIEKGCPKSCCPEKAGVPCTCQCRHNVPAIQDYTTSTPGICKQSLG